MTEGEILEYAQECGLESAANLLLLIGPDGFKGYYDAYLKLEKYLNGGLEHEDD